VEAETLHNFTIAVVGDTVLDLDNPRRYCSSLPTKIPSKLLEVFENQRRVTARDASVETF
jgi:hypothetical protein